MTSGTLALSRVLEELPSAGMSHKLSAMRRAVIVWSIIVRGPASDVSPVTHARVRI